MASKGAVDIGGELVVAFADADGDLILELKRLEIGSIRDRLDRQRYGAVAAEIAGERTPYGGDVDRAVLDRLDDAGRRIGLPVVAVNRIADEIGDHALLAERVRRRRVVAVVADQLHADGKMFQARVADRPQITV